jgi:predicted GNAT family N-acyltransferase
VIEQVARAEIVSIRHEVLRPGLPAKTALYPEDDLAEVFHLAEREDDGTIIACVTFFPDDLDGEPAWRFRGMATLEPYRNAGIGGRLLEAGVDEVVRRGGKRIWCNGRSVAAAFYRRHGFVPVGEEFASGPQKLPHFVFTRVVS